MPLFDPISASKIRYLWPSVLSVASLIREYLFVTNVALLRFALMLLLFIVAMAMIFGVVEEAGGTGDGGDDNEVDDGDGDLCDSNDG